MFGLDAAVVAVAWQYLFAETLKIRIPTEQYLVLGLIVWTIYSADRFVDALRLSRPETASARHRFYRDHLPLMGIVTALGVVGSVFCILTMLPQNIITPGLAVGALVLLYFFHRIYSHGPVLALLPKEVFSGLVFAVGATLLGFTWSSRVPLGLVSSEVLSFGVLCVVNCLAISVWERAEDAGNDPNAVAQLWPGATEFFPKLAAAAAGGITIVALVNFRGASFPIYAASALGLILLAVLAFRASSMRPPVLRVLADVAVLLPALALLPIAPWASTS